MQKSVVQELLSNGGLLNIGFLKALEEEEKREWLHAVRVEQEGFGKGLSIQTATEYVV